MKQIKKVALLGGGGRTGNFIVSQLLREGYSLNVLLRKPQNFRHHDQSIEIIQGDACDAEAINTLLKGCQAVINTVSQRQGEPRVASAATRNILHAMIAHEISRYIVVAGLNVDTPFDKKSAETKAATEWMKTNFPDIHEDRQKTYALLSASAVNWTLVRVPFIDFTDVRSQTSVNIENCTGNKISAANIAAFVTGQLSDNSYSRKAPFIANI